MPERLEITGLPPAEMPAVVANDAAGDVGENIRRYRVGVVVEETSAPAMRRAVSELAALTRDEDLAQRCRAVAEEWFSLENGAARYDALCRQIGEDRTNDYGGNRVSRKSDDNVLS